MGPPTGVTGAGVGRSFPEVLGAAHVGESSAYTALYRMCAPRVLGFVRARGVDDPDGVVNEAFLGASRGLSGFEGDESAFHGWLFAITRNSRCPHVKNGPVADVQDGPQAGIEDGQVDR